MQLTVIIPTYNEAENLPRLISALFVIPLDISVIVVDDNSPDGTGELAERMAKDHPGRVQVIHRSGKLGLRTAYIEGFQLAFCEKNDCIVQMDADLSHDPTCLVAMAEMIRTCQVVLGSRYAKGGKVDENWSIWRKALSAWGNYYARTLLGLPLKDITTGFRMWQTEVLKEMPLDRIHSNGYVFLVEMAFVAHRMGFRFGEVPIYFADRSLGRSKMSFKIQLEAAFRIWELLWSYRDLHSK